MNSECARHKYLGVKRACAASNLREKAYAGPGLIQEAQVYIAWGVGHQEPKV